MEMKAPPPAQTDEAGGGHGMRSPQARWLKASGIAVGIAVAVLGVLFAALLWGLDGARPTIERLARRQLGREVRIERLEFDLVGGPRLRVHALEVANAPGFAPKTMARVRLTEIALQWRGLFTREPLISRVRLAGVEGALARDADGRANWVLPGLAPPAKASPEASKAPPFGSLVLDDAQLSLEDQQIPVRLRLRFEPVPAQPGTTSVAPPGHVASAAAPGQAPPHAAQRYARRLVFEGRFRDSRLDGEMLMGEALHLQHDGPPAPLRGELRLDDTRIKVEGEVAHARPPMALDMRVDVSGPTLANLYPFLMLPLPASPPYQLGGRLVLKQGRYAIEDLGGRIGSTDLRGHGRYTLGEPRPRLEIVLRSDRLKLADLGPLIGVETASRDRPTPASQADSEGEAQAADRQARGDRVLPSGRFDAERLRLIDADVRLHARGLVASAGPPLENLEAVLRLRDAVLHLDPFEMGVAGGTLHAKAILDGRGKTLQSSLDLRLKRLRWDRLVPDHPRLEQGKGLIHGQLTLRGRGASIADAAARADGRLAVATADGRISNLLDAASGLNLGKVLRLLAGGDRTIELRCGGLVFAVDDGQGRTELLVLDTAQTQVVGAGTFDLGREQIALQVEAQPKSPGILSLRTPVRVGGSFSEPSLSVDSTPLLLKGAGALALGAAVGPLAALLPLIETGPGEDTACGPVLAQARAAGRR